MEKFIPAEDLEPIIISLSTVVVTLNLIREFHILEAVRTGGQSLTDMNEYLDLIRSVVKNANASLIRLTLKREGMENGEADKATRRE